MPLYNNDNTKNIESQYVDEDFVISIPSLNCDKNVKDTLSDGRIDWRLHKMSGNKVADIIEYYDKEKSTKIRNCGNHLTFGLKPDGGKILLGADFCKLRICPMCAWRRSYRLGVQMDQLFAALIARNPNAIIIHFTVTCANPSSDYLAPTIKKMGYAHRYMTHYCKTFTDRVQGFYRSMEVTYNEEKDTYHPHYHYLLHMRDDYFDGKYMSMMAWVNLWRDCMGLDYEPSAYVEAINADGNRTMTDAVLEVSKYPLKPLKYAKISSDKKAAEVLHAIDMALKGVRLLAFGGTIKNLRAELKQADIEADNADLVGGDTSAEYVQKVAYVWRNGYYYRDFDNVESVDIDYDTGEIIDGCQISDGQPSEG